MTETLNSGSGWLTTSQIADIEKKSVMEIQPLLAGLQCRPSRRQHLRAEAAWNEHFCEHALEENSAKKKETKMLAMAPSVIQTRISMKRLLQTWVPVRSLAAAWVWVLASSKLPKRSKG